MSSLLAQLLGYIFAKALKGKPRAQIAIGIVLVLAGALISYLAFASGNRAGFVGEVFWMVIGVLVAIAGVTNLVIGINMLQRRKNAAVVPQQPSGQQPYPPQQGRYPQR